MQLSISLATIPTRLYKLGTDRQARIMFTLTRVRRAGVVLSPDLFKLEHPGLARVGKGDTVVHNCSKQIRQL